MADNTFTGGQGPRLASYIDTYRYHRRGTDRLARETVDRAKLIEGYVKTQRSPRVLDLGCGGRAGVTLTLHTLGIPTIGIDYDVVTPRLSLANCVRAAKQNGAERAVKTIGRKILFDGPYYRQVRKILGKKLRWDGLDVRTMDARDLAFADNTFSFVFSAAVFEHIADVEAAVSELHRVMRPGGHAYILVHLYPSLSGGHALDWADPDESPRLNTPIQPWDHLRDRRHKAHVYLNELRAADYLDSFRQKLDIVEQDYTTEGLHLLTPQIRDELKAWSEEDLTRRFLIVLLRKED